MELGSEQFLEHERDLLSQVYVMFSLVSYSIRKKARIVRDGKSRCATRKKEAFAVKILRKNILRNTF